MLEEELEEINQLDSALHELTHKRAMMEEGLDETHDVGGAAKGSTTAGKATAGGVRRQMSKAEARERAAEAYALEMAIHMKRAERERKKKELEAEFAATFAEVDRKKAELSRLEVKISEMESTRKRKDREFQRLQRNLMELLEEQKVELDNLREKGIELETATATSAAAAAATAKAAKENETRTEAIFQGTEQLMKQQFLSMSLTYFSSLNMLKNLRDINADTTSAAIASSADTGGCMRTRLLSSVMQGRGVPHSVPFSSARLKTTLDMD